MSQALSFFDPSVVEKYKGHFLVVDTNILGYLSTDNDFLDAFLSIFKDFDILIDPVVKFEFLQGQKSETLYKKQKGFLQFNKFRDSSDGQDIGKDLYGDILTIARVFSKKGINKIPLGDLIIMSCMKKRAGKPFVLATLDSDDFSTILMERLGVVSICYTPTSNSSKPDKLARHDMLKNISLMVFDDSKFKICETELHGI